MFWKNTYIVVFTLLVVNVSFAGNLRFFSNEHNKTFGYPYSDAVQAGRLLFLAGHVGEIPKTGKRVPGGVRAETRQALENIKATLVANGATLDDVAKCTVFLADIDDFDEMNQVYRSYFEPRFPARSTVGVAGLAFDVLVEIECIAVVPSDEENGMSEEAKIRAVIDLYTQGTYEGDADKLRQSFHPNAVMNGYLVGQLMLTTPEPFIAQMENAPIKDTDADYRPEITDIAIDGQVASVTLKETGFPGGVRFTNYFHLIDDGSGWKIISKAFFGQQ